MASAAALLALACALACSAINTAAISSGTHEDGQQQQQVQVQDAPSLGYPGYPGGGGGGDYPPYPSYPGAPGSGTSPPSGKDALPFASGSIVSLRSHVLRTYCNVGSGDEDPPYTFRCDEKDESVVWQGMLVIGQDYATNMIFDGSKITIKSQRENKVCGVGLAEDRYPITCDQPFTGCATTFQIHRAKARDDLYYITPDNMPDHKCYPAHAGHDHGVDQDSTSDGSSDNKRPRHWMRCDTHHRGDNHLLEIKLSNYYPATAAAAVPDSQSQDSVIKAGFPYWPGGPPAPGAPSAPDPDDDDVLPFTTGSTIQISDPDLEPFVCDTKDGGYGADWAWTRLSRKKKHHHHDDDDDDKKDKKEKEKEEEKRVKCDRKAPEGPGSQWIPSGFLVLADDPSVRELKSGAAIYLSNQQTHKFCRPADDKDLLDGVFCDSEKGAGTKFQVFLAHHKKHHHSAFFQTDDADADAGDEQDMVAGSTAYLPFSSISPWRWIVDLFFGRTPADKAPSTTDVGGDIPYGPPGGDGDGSKTVAVYLYHVDSNRYCGADLKSKNGVLLCDYKHKRRPKLHIKVNQGYGPGGGGGAAY